MFKFGQVKDAFGQVTFGGNLSDGQVVILVNVEPCWVKFCSFDTQKALVRI
jgi:hypothetical protein